MSHTRSAPVNCSATSRRPILASLSGPLIAGASTALYLLPAAERATLAGLLAAIANVAAGALVTAMVLV